RWWARERLPAGRVPGLLRGMGSPEPQGRHERSAAPRSPRTMLPMDERDEGRFGPAAQASEWDARYRKHDAAMWSGRPNGRLVAEVTGLSPGTALDVGCGEGADAVWLAQQGWTVTAVDVSEVAVRRGREAAE